MYQIKPVEAFEHQVPMLIEQKAFVPDTGGAGRYRGGNAQRIDFRSRSDSPITMTIRHERVGPSAAWIAGRRSG